MLGKVNTGEPKALGDEFALLVSNVVDYAIFMLDPSGHIVTWNEGAERIKGYSADEILGRHFSVFYPADQARDGKPDWELEVAKREGRYEEEGWRLRKDGTRFWANVVITALRDDTGRLRGFGKVTRDLTERHLLEQHLAAEREAEANRLREHAARMADLEHAKTEFLNLASHELRGPLTLIRGYNSMLKDGSIPPERVPAIARLLDAKLAQMNLLIEEMLEVARLEHDRLDLVIQELDLREALQEQIETFRPLADGHSFVVNGAGEPLLVKGDRSRISTIFANFLDNALKYSPGGGEISCATGRRGHNVFASVRDEGLGIAAEDMPRLFTRFGRLPTVDNESITGTGLGLFLCKEIAVRHGGDISVNSRPGGGSEFTLTLPAARQKHR